MAAVLERDRALRAETARWKRFPVGTACETDIGSRCRAIGPDLGGDHCGTVQAADSNQQERGLAGFPATRHHLQKKRVCGRQSSIAPTWPGRAGAGSESKACLIQPGWGLLTRLRSPPRWCGFGVAVPEASSSSAVPPF